MEEKKRDETKKKKKKSTLSLQHNKYKKKLAIL